MNKGALLFALAVACGGTQTATGRTPCERECDLEGQSCEAGCVGGKPDDRQTCLERCGVVHARCIAICR
jgi:hypothetical protein